MTSLPHRWYTKWYVLFPTLLFGLLLMMAGISKEPEAPRIQADEEIISPSVIPQTGEQPERGANNVSSERQPATVERVVDGDTIHVRIDGQKHKVRLIGIDTPEKNDPRKPVECFAQEATDWLSETVEGKKVLLEADDSQGNTDKYDRLLRYVFFEEKNINQQLVTQGYAYEYTYDFPYRYQDQFRQAQQEAREAGRGLWDPDVCDGQRQLVPTLSGQQSSSGGQTQGESTIQSSPDSQFRCDCSKTCKQMSSCEEAYFQLTSCGCTDRDGDGDGNPCERGPC